MTTVAECKAKLTGGTDIVTFLALTEAATNKVTAATLALQAALAATAATGRKYGTAMANANNQATNSANNTTSATNRATNAIDQQSKAADKLVASMGKVAHGAAQAFGELNKLSGVQSLDKMRSAAGDLEDALIDIQAAMGQTDDQFAAMKPKETLAKVALASGLPIKDVMGGFIEAQNETSGGANLLADDGKLAIAQAKFAKVTKATFGDTAIALAKFSEGFEISPADQARVPGALIRQQLQGSLEASTSQKFVKVGSAYRAVTGKTGFDGLNEMLALGNTIKDTKGLTGKNGAATTASWLGSLLAEMQKGKSLTGQDTSFLTIVSKALGHQVRDKQGHTDIIKLANELAAYKEKVGDLKFGQLMTTALRNKQPREAMLGLVEAARLRKGKDNSMEALSKPDDAAGQALIDNMMAKYAKSVNTRNIMLDNKEAITQLDNSEGFEENMLSYREEMGQFMAAHPWVNAASESSTVKGAAGAVLGLGAKAMLASAPGAIAALPGSVGAFGYSVAQAPVAALGVPALAAGALTMEGDLPPAVAASRHVAELQKNLRKREKQGGGENSRGSFGDMTGFSTTASMREHLAEGQANLVAALKSIPAPQVNVYVQQGMLADVVQGEGKTSAARAKPQGPVMPQGVR